MILSFNPSYLCNSRCSFCYLSDEQLSSDEKTDLGRFIEVIDTLNVDGVELYGGEVTLLPEGYVREIIHICKEKEISLSVVTNLIKVPEWLTDQTLDFELTVSYDHTVRRNNQTTLTNLLLLDRDFSLNVLVTKELIASSFEDFKVVLSAMGRLQSIDFKPYSKSKHRAEKNDFEAYVKYLIRWLESDTDINIKNIETIYNSIHGRRNSFSDDHVYLRPNGALSVLDFDENGDEYFLDIDSCEDYEKWTEDEKKRVAINCAGCRFIGSCLTEHYRRDDRFDNGTCSGFRNLLDYVVNLEPTRKLQLYGKSNMAKDYHSYLVDSNVISSFQKILDDKESLIFPAKSYLVSIVYAEIIAGIEGITLLDSLRRLPALPSDKFSKAYDEIPDIYNELLERYLSSNFKKTETYSVIVSHAKEELLLC